VTNLKEDTNDGLIFILVICGGLEAYAARVEQHMVGGVNGPSCRSEILGLATSSVHTFDVITE
jgi:hypothetical protein